jgi:Xaa-Pro aminopeptidase
MRSRLQTLQTEITKHNLDAILVSHPTDISYLTGFSNFSADEREGFLLITKAKSYIITDGRYDEAVRKLIPDVTVLVRTHDKPLQKIFSELVTKHALQIVGINEHDLRVAEYLQLKKTFPKLVPFSTNSLRSKKSSAEIQKIKKACAIGDETFTFILPLLTVGVTEKEIAFEMEYFIRKNGADLSFPSIVAFGANSSVPHHHTGNTKLKHDDFVLLDFGVKFENYCSDMTRTVVFGKATEKQKKMYKTVLTAQQKAIENIEHFYSSSKVRSTSSSRLANARSNNKLLVSSVDKVARDYIVSQGYPTIPHSLGHGIGLEVHEAPSLSPGSKEILEEGMVFSIEPGIYIPDFGGVRIEDLFTIQKEKLIQLTKSPRQLIIV